MKINIHAKRAFSLLYKMDSSYVYIVLLNGILQAMLYYVPIIILAQVLNGLDNHNAFGTCVSIALVGVISVCLLQIGQAGLKKKIDIKSQYLSYYFETLVARKTMTIDYSQLGTERTRELHSRIKVDRSWGSGFFGVTAKIQIIIHRFVSIIMSVLILFPLFARACIDHNWLFILTIIIEVVVSIISAIFLDGWYSRREIAAMNEMTKAETTSRFQYLSEGGGAITYRDIKDILLYNVSQLIYPTLELERQKVREHAKNLSAINGQSGMIRGSISGFLLVASYCVTTMCASIGEIGVGFIAQYAQTIYQLTKSIIEFLRTYTELKVDATRLGSTMDYLELEKKEIEEVEMIPRVMQVIEFVDVSFSYPGTDKKVFDHLNLKIDADKRTAIVGLNGSGKTTLIKLLCRLYKPDKGTIRLNGVDIWQYKEEAFWNLLSVVFQDFSLFSFALGDVVASSESYDDEKIKDALMKAGLGAWVESLNNGLGTILYKEYEDNGVEVSGGEAQKIAIARAVYKNAPLVILDEPTAALDPKSELEIYTGFSQLIGKRGAIYISHRLASCQFCDDIIVLEDGREIERGTHKDLLDINGKYMQMWNAQAQYYKD